MNDSTLETKVEAYKLIARDSLRMNLISAHLTHVGVLEGEIKDSEETKARNEHEIKVENYEISKLDVDHPNFDKRKESKEETVKHLTERSVRFDKEIFDLTNAVAEQKAAIAKIESGETKVSLENLNCLVEKMVKQDALNQVK